MSTQLSIITAIHNGLPMNQLYWESLQKNTRSSFELIIVDNHSTDGSEKFFSNLSAKIQTLSQRVLYIRNEKNHSYPASQNQGILKANSDILCFFNNDLYLPKGWDTGLIERIYSNPYRVLSFSGIEAQPTQKDSDLLKRKWKRVTALSRLWRFLFQKTELERLWKSLELMYGPHQEFLSSIIQKPQTMIDGINGSAVVMHRLLLKLFKNIWDERFQAADWHLYLSLAKYRHQNPDFPLPQIQLDKYIHHFGRYSYKQNYEPLADASTLKALETEWNSAEIQKLWWGHQLEV